MCLKTGQVLDVGTHRLRSEGRMLLGVEKEVDYVRQG